MVAWQNFEVFDVINLIKNTFCCFVLSHIAVQASAGLNQLTVQFKSIQNVTYYTYNLMEYKLHSNINGKRAVVDWPDFAFIVSE